MLSEVGAATMGRNNHSLCVMTAILIFFSYLTVSFFLLHLFILLFFLFKVSSSHFPKAFLLPTDACWRRGGDSECPTERLTQKESHALLTLAASTAASPELMTEAGEDFQSCFHFLGLSSARTPMSPIHFIGHTPQHGRGAIHWPTLDTWLFLADMSIN